MQKKGIDSKPISNLHVKGNSASFEKKNNFFINNYITSAQLNQGIAMSSKENISNPISKKNFIFQFVIGRGGFGKVWKVEEIKTKKLYAMKEMSKSK